MISCIRSALTSGHSHIERIGWRGAGVLVDAGSFRWRDRALKLVDSSAAMAAKLANKPANTETTGNFVDFSLIFVAFCTFFCLSGQEEQLQADYF